MHYDLYTFLVALGYVIVITLPIVYGLHLVYGRKWLEEENGRGPNILGLYFLLIGGTTFYIWATYVEHLGRDRVIWFLSLFVSVFIIYKGFSKIAKMYSKYKKEEGYEQKTLKEFE